MIIHLLLLSSYCSFRDFDSNPNLDLWLNEPRIDIISPVDLQEQFIIDQLPLSICFRDYSGIEQITITTPQQTINPTINIGTKTTIIDYTLFISNTASPPQDQYPLEISYTTMNGRVVTSNYNLSIKVLSPHFSIDHPPNREAAVESDFGTEAWRGDPKLKINTFYSGAPVTKIEIAGLDSSTQEYINPPNSFSIPFSTFKGTPPSGDLIFNITIYTENGSITTNITLS